MLFHLVDEGLISLTCVGVDREGLVSVEEVAAAMRPETILVTVMHSNNEVGSLQPIKEIAKLCRERGVLCHTDAAQSVGKVAVKVKELGVDLCTIVGHKFGAPKGVAALYVHQRLPPLPPFLHGGGQENGRRAGTENVMLIAGMGRAAEVVEREGPRLAWHMRAMRDRLWGRLCDGLGKGRLVRNGPVEDALRLPNTLSVAARGVGAAGLLAQLSETVAASAGAACHGAGGVTMSPVLNAMGVSEEVARGTLRLSVGRHTTAEEVDRAVAALVREAKAALVHAHS